ncbi:DUF2474 domain-containing protein [Xenorhabdus sp. XENO-7]|uniref:DUF2474 domain-containing protein n=1 Tax=Xenorhabdus aichiensis TaxID=3025874 RepID=A0ABT5M834_9GAMM|nr:DUF2474 domain-containing protein [Xenorhabdus aichiensis]MDC9623873.1 DUF2474 domain-containing protein [Xenorhabdus aichiensis]
MNKVITESDSPRPSLWKRLGWLVTIWLGSVLALYAVSSLFRVLMTTAGMKVK